MRSKAVKSILVAILVMEFMVLPVHAIDSLKYLPTLTFGGPKDPFPPGLPEAFFPVRYDFDGDRNISNNKANYTDYMVATAGTPTINPLAKVKKVKFDQMPTIYFHLGPGVNIGGKGYVVYEYWLYYVYNPWVKSHSHDWEAYFVYESKGRPEYIGLGFHESFHLYKWSNVTSYGTHPHLHVDKGSHAMRTGNHHLGEHPIDHESIHPILEGAGRMGIDVSRTPVPAILNIVDCPEDGVTITWDGEVRIPPHMGGGITVQNYRISGQVITIGGPGGPPQGLPPQWGTVTAPWLQTIWKFPPTSSVGLARPYMQINRSRRTE